MLSDTTSKMNKRYSVEILEKQPGRDLFSCGSAPLDRYLQKQAGQEARKRVAVTYLLIDNENQNRIAGFYTLSSTNIIPGHLPEGITKKLPRYESIPATLIGRLAIDKPYQGQGLGSVILIEALQQCYQTSQQVASYAVIVDAKDERAKSFYQGFGFISFPSKPDRLFLPMETVEMLIMDRK